MPTLPTALMLLKQEIRSFHKYVTGLPHIPQYFILEWFVDNV